MIRFPHSALLLTLVLAAALVPAAALEPAAASGVLESRPPAPDRKLLACMNKLKEHLGGLALALQGGEIDGALEHVAELQSNVLQAKLMKPSNLKQVEKEERDAHVSAFRLELVRVLRELSELEIDLLEGRPESAFNRITGPLFKLREDAHGRFQESE